MSTTASQQRQVTIKLHSGQATFCRSDATYRALAGGIGSGKSFAGSYDLIRRSKPGRLYMVVAPTYGMLADATFRSFLAVAEQLGVVEPGDVKKSPPPSIRLGTGAEVLFRSADDPKHLRGPNLSGIWLDEASLMHVDAFNICIGRLREAGEQGWLSATFTPKGKGHWTYETFARGKADTAIFRARTTDNPFLPPGFVEKLSAQYTSVMAAQELAGDFTDTGGTMFLRHWFGIADAVPAALSLVRAWDLAASAKDPLKSHDPDWTVGVLMGHAPSGVYYVTDVRRLRARPAQLEMAVTQIAQVDSTTVPVWMEQEPGSAGVTVISAYARMLAGFSFHGERSTGDKSTRAAPLAAQAEAGNVKLLRAPWNKDFLDEFESFPFGSHDDIVDAASLAFAKCTSGFVGEWRAGTAETQREGRGLTGNLWPEEGGGFTTNFPDF